MGKKSQHLLWELLSHTAERSNTLTDAWTDGVIIISDRRQKEEGKNNEKSRTGTIYQLMQINQFTHQKNLPAHANEPIYTAKKKAHKHRKPSCNYQQQQQQKI